MDQPSRQRADAHHQGGPWRGEGNRNQRGGGRGRGYDGGGGNRPYNSGYNRPGNQWNNNYRQDNRQYNQEERQQSGGFGKPSYHKGPNVQHQEDMAQGQNNFNDRARPKDKNHDYPMRDSSPDRQERWRPLKDKNDEDHTRDPSPDRSLPKHCIQENRSLSANASNQDQSQQAIRANQVLTSKRAPAELFLDILTKEEREALLNRKMEEIRKKNDALRKRHELIQLAKEEIENDVKSTKCIEEEEFPNSSDFVYDLEDSTSSLCTVQKDSLGVKTASGSVVLGKLKDDYPNTPPNSWEDDNKFVDAISAQEPEEKFVESYEETITIDKPDNSISAVDYLMEKDVVAVHVEPFKDGFRRIACVTEDKSFLFEIENNPDLMISGKVAEFFNWTPEPKGPIKVFNGLDSKTCAVFFDKHDIILDGTRIFDLKIAYDMMREYGLGDMTKLKKTGFSPDCIHVDTDNVTAVCVSYIKAHQYFSREIMKEMKDYKKELFNMVKADICKEDLKELRDRKKKEIKAADFSKSKSHKLKKSKDFSFPPLPLQSNKTEINFESERKLKNIPNSDSWSSHSSTFAEHLLKECNSPAINLQAASTHPSLNSTLQQEFNETRQMARQCVTQKSQEEQCQVIAVVKHESVEFPDGRRYTCRSTIVPDSVIVEGKSTGTQTESDKCKDVGVQCEIIDWNKYQKMIELAEVLLK